MKTPPYVRVGPYRLVEFVGAGGMGEVYRAVHESSGKFAAVKFLTGASAKDLKMRERFANEARVQESLHHPGLVAFYGWHECGGTSCIVMEYADGQTFGERIQASGRMAFEEAAWLFARVCEAIGHMHAHGVVHRDIKSSNVKVTTKGQVKLLDFGIAKTAISPQLTATNSFIGTLQYLAPEQVKSGHADARSDVWALGALFYEMLSGRVPFDAPTLGELCEKIARADYPSLSSLRPDTPREAQNIIARCLKKHPNDRYPDANALLSDVRALLSAPKPQAKTQPGRTLPARRWLPVAAATGGAALILLIVLSQRGPAPEPSVPKSEPPIVENDFIVSRDERNDRNRGRDEKRNGGEFKIVRVEVADDPGGTRIYRNGELIGYAPQDLETRVGESFEVRLKCDGFRERRAEITVTASLTTRTFTLERLPE